MIPQPTLARYLGETFAGLDDDELPLIDRLRKSPYRSESGAGGVVLPRVDYDRIDGICHVDSNADPVHAWVEGGTIFGVTFDVIEWLPPIPDLFAPEIEWFDLRVRFLGLVEDRKDILAFEVLGDGDS